MCSRPDDPTQHDAPSFRHGRFDRLAADALCQRRDCGRPMAEHGPGSYGRGTANVGVLAVCPTPTLEDKR